jgi:hypothetical protein
MWLSKAKLLAKVSCTGLHALIDSILSSWQNLIVELTMSMTRLGLIGGKIRRAAPKNRNLCSVNEQRMDSKVLSRRWEVGRALLIHGVQATTAIHSPTVEWISAAVGITPNLILSKHHCHRSNPLSLDPTWKHKHLPLKRSLGAWQKRMRRL